MVVESGFSSDDTESEDRWFHHAVIIENPNRGWIVEAQVTVSYLSASGELLDGITASSIRLVDILPGARVASVDERQYMERDEDVDHLAIELEVLSWQTIEGPVGSLAFSNVTTTPSDYAPGWYDTYGCVHSAFADPLVFNVSSVYRNQAGHILGGNEHAVSVGAAGSNDFTGDNDPGEEAIAEDVTTEMYWSINAISFSDLP